MISVLAIGSLYWSSQPPINRETGYSNVLGNLTTCNVSGSRKVIVWENVAAECSASIRDWLEPNAFTRCLRHRRSSLCPFAPANAWVGEAATVSINHCSSNCLCFTCWCINLLFVAQHQYWWHCSVIMQNNSPQLDQCKLTQQTNKQTNIELETDED